MCLCSGSPATSTSVSPSACKIWKGKVCHVCTGTRHGTLPHPLTGDKVKNTQSVWHQNYSHLPNHTASLPTGQYQTIRPSTWPNGLCFKDFVYLLASLDGETWAPDFIIYQWLNLGGDVLFTAPHRIIWDWVSSANRMLKTMLMLDSARQDTAISKFHVPRSTLVTVHLQSPGQCHGTDLPPTIRSSASPQGFKTQLKAQFFLY